MTHVEKRIIKIGTVELLKVKRSARALYLKLDKILADCYGIEPGDTLRVKIEELIKVGAAASLGEVEE